MYNPKASIIIFGWNQLDYTLLDCAIFSHILAYLRNPWTILRKFRRHSSLGGKMICLLPNILHDRRIKDLLRGPWFYREEGILNRDPLQFFPLDSIKEMLGVAGYRIERIAEKQKAGTAMKILNGLWDGSLHRFLTQQYLIVCGIRDDQGPSKILGSK